MGSGNYGQMLCPLRVWCVSTVGGTWVGTLSVYANVLELSPKTDQRSVDICHLVIFVRYQFIVIFYCSFLSLFVISLLLSFIVFSYLCSLSVYCYLLLFFPIFVLYQSIVIFYCFFLSSVLMAILTDNLSSSILLLSITLQTIGLPARQSRIYTTIEASQNGAVRRINYCESQYNLALVPNNVPM